jgi:hypothetical protein
MTVILDPYKIPEKGEFEVVVRRKVNLQVTAEAAQRTVQRWLLHQVSYMMGAETPQLVISSSDVFWRVPVILTASPIGPVGVVGEVDVFVENGQIDREEERRRDILQRGQELAAGLPPYQPRSTMPAGYEAVVPSLTRQPGRPADDPRKLLLTTMRSVEL